MKLFCYTNPSRDSTGDIGESWQSCHTETAAGVGSVCESGLSILFKPVILEDAHIVNAAAAIPHHSTIFCHS